eukprot:TRINITY_DN49735_c0_g1_i1.p1 TRINITY_DN49735_c0_g1~~TRINITY_DN49735_c0_g1_i1.p1  ORF type:complete len:249 (-),score=53.65 TRINITY_DN49735_c0_g1_i1:37-783(-)
MELGLLDSAASHRQPPGWRKACLATFVTLLLGGALSICTRNAVVPSAVEFAEQEDQGVPWSVQGAADEVKQKADEAADTVEQTYHTAVDAVKQTAGEVWNTTAAAVKATKEAGEKSLGSARKVSSVHEAYVAWGANFNLSRPDQSAQFFSTDIELIYYNKGGRKQFRRYVGWPAIRTFMMYLEKVECPSGRANFRETYEDEEGKTLFLVWDYPGTKCKETTETWVYNDDYKIKRITAYYNWEVQELAP